MFRIGCFGGILYKEAFLVRFRIGFWGYIMLE